MEKGEWEMQKQLSRKRGPSRRRETRHAKRRLTCETINLDRKKTHLKQLCDDTCNNKCENHQMRLNTQLKHITCQHTRAMKTTNFDCKQPFEVQLRVKTTRDVQNKQL